MSQITATPPALLPYTDDDEANRLIAQDPLALLIGFVLDQQVPVQKAFSGPLALQQRLGHLDARRIAESDPAELVEVFKQRPAIHRFPGSMAGRVQALCAFVVERYDGDASRVWSEAESGADLRRRLGELPGFGDMKVRTVISLLTEQYGVRPPGWEAEAPTHPTLGKVRTAEELSEYQAGKRAHKAALRAARAAG
jgi:uncharacterized HhH-GPD family protein